MSKKNVANISIESATILFRNFAGKPDKYNPTGGKRSFSVLLDPDVADELDREGWNIKTLKPRDEDDAPKPFIQVAVNYGNIPPKIWLVNKNKKKTLLDEESIESLDYAEIENIDVVIRPHCWEVTGKEGIKAYVKDMYVTIVEDEFAAKYAEE